MSATKITDDIIHKAVARGLTNAEIATECGVTERSVARAKTRTGLAKPRVAKYSPETLARIRTLREEGMPITWIAEDVARSVSSVARRLGHIGGDADWPAVWASIRHNQELLDLHRELAPR